MRTAHGGTDASVQPVKARPVGCVLASSMTRYTRGLWSQQNGNALSTCSPHWRQSFKNSSLSKPKAELASQLAGLSVIERCRCGNDFCGTFYVLPKPDGAYGLGHRNVALEPNEGMLTIHAYN